jgi:hypothetical protein
MRIIHILALLIFPSVLTAQDAAKIEPRDLVTLRESWTKARNQATAPIDKKYVEALQAMKLKATKAGDLQAALAFEKEIEALPEKPEETNSFIGDCTIRAYGKDHPTKLLADYTVTRGNRPVGKWKITRTQFIITFQGGSSDVFDLPIQDKTLYGKSTAGEPLKMTILK